jgi:hypothetical protein
MATEPTSEALAKKIFWIVLAMCVGYTVAAIVLVS